MIQAEAAKSQERQIFLQDVWDSWGNGLQAGHRYCNRMFKEDLGLPALPLDVYTTPSVYPKNLSIYIEDGKDTIITANCFYTDGSKTKFGSGYGWIFSNKPIESQRDIHNSVKTHGPLGDSTVFQAETFAVIDALKWFQKSKYKHNNVTFFVDSQGVLKSIQTLHSSSHLTRELLYLIGSLKGEINFIWTKSHIGILGNETADKLAKLGAQEDFLGPLPVFPISSRVNKTLWKDAVDHMWSQYWIHYDQGRQTKYWLNAPNQAFTRKLLLEDRTSIRSIIGFITGHNALMYHQSNCYPQLFQPHCRLCDHIPETTYHLVRECPGTLSFHSNFLINN